MSTNQRDPNQPQKDPQGAKPRDLSRYESNPARILQSLAITLVIGTVFLLILKFVFKAL
jgi:hypothetical protein